MILKNNSRKALVLRRSLLILLMITAFILSTVPTANMGNPPFSGNRDVKTDVITALQYEPVIVSDSSGTIYVAWRDNRNDEGDIYFANSTDGGTTWTIPNVKINTDTGSEIQGTPALAMSSTGTLYAAWSDNRNGNLDIYFAKSTDEGATWTDPNIRINTDGGSDQQSDPDLVVDSDDTIYIVWQDTRSGMDWDIYFAKSTDDGATWTDPNVKVSTDTTSAYQFNPTIAVTSIGTIYIAWEDGRNGNYDIYFAKSTDGGATWSDPNIKVNSDETTATQSYPTIAVDSADSIHLAWQDHRNGEGDIYFARSIDGGVSWTDPNVRINTDTEARTQRVPSISVDPIGTIFVTWEDHRNNHGDIYFAKSTDGGGTWTDPNLRVNDDLRTNGKQQYDPNLAVDVFGNVYVVWEDQRSGNWDIYFASLQPEHPISPSATYLKVDGYFESTPEIKHLITHEPTFSFTYYDMNSDSLTQYNASVWDAEGSSLLWYCNITMTELAPSGTEVSLKYNTLPYPTNGPPLEDGTTYKLRVSVENSTGTWSYFSEADFHMNEVVAPIAPLSPTDDTVIAASSSQIVNWTSPEPDSEGDSPVVYYWQVATDSAFTNVIASGSGTNTTSDAFSTAPTTSYYWRVNLYDGWETGSYGNATYGYWNFTTFTSSTENSPPTITNKASVPNSVVVNSTLTFTFIATDADFDSLVWTKVSGPNWLDIGSANGTIYGTPSLNDLGNNDFTIQVSDGVSGIDSHTFTINVQTDQEGNGDQNGGDTDDSLITLVLVLIIIIVIVFVILLIVKQKKKSGNGENIY